MDNFTFRYTEEKDLPEVLAIYEHARIFMRDHDNPTQWGNNWPPQSLIEQDIAQKISYVCLYDGKIVGVFAYFFGTDIDPTYRIIENGQWYGNNTYGVVHRLAGSGTVKGIATACLDYAYSISSHLRVDTHKDNYVMQNILMKCGFKQCGIIYIEKDNSPRIAFEKI